MYNLLIFGDSITWGAWDTQSGWVSRLQADVTRKVITTDFSNNIHIYNLGVCGDNTNKLVARFKSEATLRQRPSKKTVVLFAIGINDSQIYKETQENRVPFDEFKANIKRLADEASNLGGVIFLGPTPVDEDTVDRYLDTPEKTYTNVSIARYNEFLKDFCMNRSLPFINVLDDWLSNDHQSQFVDGLHPNDLGHEAIYKKVKQFLLDNQLFN